MKKIKGLILIGIMMCFIIALTACSTNKNEVTSAQITSVVNNKEGLQENAFYNFDNGKLDVMISYSPFENPNTSPTDSNYDKKLDEVIANLNKEFPNENMTKDNFDNKLEKTFKHVTVTVDKEKKKVTIDGNDVKKIFTMSDTNDNRLIDDFGNEYELNYSE